MAAFTDPPPQTVRLILRSGEGGHGAKRSTALLATMYQCFAVRQHWGRIILDYLPASHGGCRHMVLVVQGVRAYDRLRYETGIHRLQEHLPLTPPNRIHTSTVLVMCEMIPNPAYGIPASPWSDTRADPFDPPRTRIRTYHLPQHRLTDHRLLRNFTPVEQFLDGDLEPLLDALDDAGGPAGAAVP